MGWEWRLFYQGDLRAAFCDHVATRLPTMRRKGEDELRTDVYVRWSLCQQNAGRRARTPARVLARARSQPAATVQGSPNNTSPVTLCARTHLSKQLHAQHWRQGSWEFGAGRGRRDRSQAPLPAQEARRRICASSLRV
jgi:hypothetical protein